MTEGATLGRDPQTSSFCIRKNVSPKNLEMTFSSSEGEVRIGRGTPTPGGSRDLKKKKKLFPRRLSSRLSGTEPNCLSGAVSDKDKRSEKLAELGGGHRRPLHSAAPLPPFGQFGVGWWRETHGTRSCCHHLRRPLLLPLRLQIVLLRQLPVHSHRLSGKKRQVFGAAVSVDTKNMPV